MASSLIIMPDHRGFLSVVVLDQDKIPGNPEMSRNPPTGLPGAGTGQCGEWIHIPETHSISEHRLEQSSPLEPQMNKTWSPFDNTTPYLTRLQIVNDE